MNPFLDFTHSDAIAIFISWTNIASSFFSDLILLILGVLQYQYLWLFVLYFCPIFFGLMLKKAASACQNTYTVHSNKTLWLYGICNSFTFWVWPKNEAAIAACYFPASTCTDTCTTNELPILQKQQSYTRMVHNTIQSFPFAEIFLS